jgi:hypothetical protein
MGRSLTVWRPDLFADWGLEARASPPSRRPGGTGSVVFPTAPTRKRAPPTTRPLAWAVSGQGEQYSAQAPSRIIDGARLKLRGPTKPHFQSRYVMLNPIPPMPYVNGAPKLDRGSAADSPHLRMPQQAETRQAAIIEIHTAHHDDVIAPPGRASRAANHPRLVRLPHTAS